MGKIRSLVRMPQVALLLETSTEYGRGLLRGIVRYSRLHGPWSLYVAPGHLEQALPKSRSWKGTGIIARVRSPEMAKLIRSTGLPCVASSLDESRAAARAHKYGEIRTNSEAIGHMAAAHLVERNLRHFAFCGFLDCDWSAGRETAFASFLAERGFRSRAHHIELTNWLRQPHWIENWEDEQTALVEWLRSLPKPVGLMACNDTCGREVLQACAAAGLGVPDDVAVVGVDNDELICELSNPPLSSVALDLEKGGYESAKLLNDLMAGDWSRNRVVNVEPVYVVTRLSSDVIGHGDTAVAAALRFINNYAGKPISVFDVVEQAQVSRRTLERRFARALGRSISEEITERRMQRAKRLLVETDLPSYQVAIEAGFGNVKSFNRVFRHAAGVSPKRFRLIQRPKMRRRERYA